MRNVAIYVRVSTNKDDQLNSLETQREFFESYCDRNNYCIAKVYADEGISGTKMKNRKALMQLLDDSTKGIFDTVLIKDLSRLARNTLDFLTIIRQLKSNGITILFVNYNMNTEEVSEFMLTILAGIAQEESANISKRVKFSKDLNKSKGKVPNIVYGYNKIPDEIFTLEVNQKESEVVKRIYNMYVNDGLGANKIMQLLNKEGIKTKRGCNWSQEGVSRILKNEIYTGKIVNGKESIKDFLTGEREYNNPDSWYVHYNDSMRIISNDIYNKAQDILKSRHDAFKLTGERTSNKYVFSKMIKCKCCGYSFRRNVKTYKNTYIYWTCAGRSANGKDSCPNKTVIDEKELLESIKEYFMSLLDNQEEWKKGLKARLKKEYKKIYAKLDNESNIREQIKELEKQKQKEMDIYRLGLMTLEQLQEISLPLQEKINKLTSDLNVVVGDMLSDSEIDRRAGLIVNNMRKVIKVENWDNKTIRNCVDHIEVDENGHTNIVVKRVI